MSLQNVEKDALDVAIANESAAAPYATSNALTDFDMCVALAQNAINSQLYYAWASWKRRQGFAETITIKKVKKDGKLVDSKYGLRDVILAPLAVSLNVPGGRLGQVRVTLSLVSGAVDYYDEASDSAASFAFTKQDSWSVSFIVDLDKAPIDLNTLAAIDPDAHKEAQNVIASSGLSDTVFSIEYLFMDLTTVDLLLEGDKDVLIPDDVPDSARTKALSCLNLMLEGDLGRFMLGTVVRRNNLEAVPTFALTDFIFDVHANPETPNASTLAYLGMLAHRPLSNNIDAARLKLQDSWIDPAMVDGRHGLVSGVMAISKSVLLDKYLIGWFSKLIGREPSAQGLAWAYSGGGVNTWNSSDIIDREWERSVSWTVSLAVQPGSNKIAFGGRISSHAYMDGYTKGAHWHTEDIHIEGYQDFSGSVELQAKGIGVNFEVVPKMAYSFGDLQVTKDEIEGGAKVLTVFETAFTGNSTAERLRNLQAETVRNISGWIEQVFDNFSVTMAQHAFIPPGGGVFTFQNPRFSPAGDLTFDVIYQAP